MQEFEALFPEEFEPQYFTWIRSDGVAMPLCDGGCEKRLRYGVFFDEAFLRKNWFRQFARVEMCSFANRLEYVDMAVQRRLEEGSLQIEAMRQGLGNVVPLEPLRMFTWQEMEILVCGSTTIDIPILKVWNFCRPSPVVAAPLFFLPLCAAHVCVYACLCCWPPPSPTETHSVRARFDRGLQVSAVPLENS